MENKKPEIEVNDIYEKYKKSHEYMQKQGVVTKTDRNWEFYIGNQWKGINSNGEELPTANIIKPILKYKVSTIAQNSMTAQYSDSQDDPTYAQVYKDLNARFTRSWEKAKMDMVVWAMVKNAAIQGDAYAYFWSGDTNDKPQVLSNTSILFGDENIVNLQDQPYIIIVERRPLDAVIAEARENGISEDDIEMLKSDDKTEDVVFNKKEVENKVTSFLYFEKVDGVVNFAKATKDLIYKPMTPQVATQNGKSVGHSSLYPIVSFIWEQRPNSARGASEVESIIPNQLEINKTLARRAVSVKLGAFPRLAYDATAIQDPSVLDKVGMAVAVNTGGAQSISQAISYLNATNMSSDAQNLFADLIDRTTDLSGASDTALGNINPSRTSGEALSIIRDETQAPLNEQINTKQQFVEDVATLWFDLWTTYDMESFNKTATGDNGEAQLDETGNPTTVQVTPQEIENLRPSVKIDVSEDSRWSRQAEQQALDNLLQQNQVTFEEYVGLLPENASLPVGKLQKLVQQRQAQQAMMSSQMPVEDPQAPVEPSLPTGQQPVPNIPQQ